MVEKLTLIVILAKIMPYIIGGLIGWLLCKYASDRTAKKVQEANEKMMRQFVHEIAAAMKNRNEGKEN